MLTTKQHTFAELDESMEGMTFERKESKSIETPFWNEIGIAVETFGVSAAQIELEVFVHAKRNSYLHTGIKKMIDDYRGEKLADKACG